jgi:hypothetical protein
MGSPLGFGQGEQTFLAGINEATAERGKIVARLLAKDCGPKRVPLLLNAKFNIAK